MWDINRTFGIKWLAMFRGSFEAISTNSIRQNALESEAFKHEVEIL